MNTKDAGRDTPPATTGRRATYPHPLVSCMMPIVAILAIIGIAMLTLELWQRSMPGNVDVPAVIGLPAAQAQDRLLQAGLDYEVLKDSQPSETVPEGSVLSIAPAAGRSVKIGRSIKIILSSGSAYATIPDVRHLSKDAAHALLAQNELSVEKETYINDETIPADVVIAISPAIGAKVTRHSNVKLTISKGAVIDTDTVITPDNQRIHTDTLSINVPADAEAPAVVRIEVTDNLGMHEVYRQRHNPGDSFVFTVEGQGEDSIVNVFFGANNILSKHF